MPDISLDRERKLLFSGNEVDMMKKMHRVLSVFLAVLTLAGLLAVLPAKAEAAGISAPVATVSNDAATGKVLKSKKELD